MQIADRFHLHQNLSAAIKEALKSEIANKIMIPDAANDECDKDEKQDKKNRT